MLILEDYTPSSVQDLSILTWTALMALRGLVYRSDEFRTQSGYYGDVFTKIKAALAAAKLAQAVNPPSNMTDAQAEALAVGQTLAAVAFKLSTIPALAVESEGTDKRRSYFSTRVNWEELAKDVLDTLFLPVGAPGSSLSFIVANRDPLDTTFALYYPYLDEVFLAVAGSRRPTIYGRLGKDWYI